MTRSFRPDPLPPGALERWVDLATRSPSAGKTQGWHLVALDGDDTARFWDVTMPPARRETFAWPGLFAAPSILLPLADRDAYLTRYSEPDKLASGLGDDPAAWPVPYWTIDTAMAVMTLLLAIEDDGFGALFFGVFHGTDELADTLGLPDGLQVLGAIAVGVPAGDDRPGRSAARGRRQPSQVIHRGGW